MVFQKERELNRRFVMINLVLQCLQLGGYLLAAGCWYAFRGWLFAVLLVGGFQLARRVISKSNPDIFKYRRKVGAGTPRWDRVWLLALFLTHCVVFVIAGLDAERFGWAPLPWWSLIPGLAVFGVGFGISTWAMAVNPHFEGTVRIQTDRNHQTIDRGPYQLVRHPGYVGFCFTFSSMPLVLGSTWALVPVAVLLGLVFLRTTLEDKLLREKLTGYSDYASRVRYRLIPGVW